jgi:hypothetical protein
MGYMSLPEDVQNADEAEVHRSSDSQGGYDSRQSESDSQGPRAREQHQSGRVLSLGVDSEGGYAVPYQLDTKKKRPKK